MAKHNKEKLPPIELADEIDKSLENAFLDLLIDKEASSGINYIIELHEQLQKKGFEHSLCTLHTRINPNLKQNREAGVPKDLANITPEQLKVFEAGITTWTGRFRYSFFEKASMLLPLGWLKMDKNEKNSKVAERLWDSPETKEILRKNITKALTLPGAKKKRADTDAKPETIEKRSNATRKLWDSSEWKEGVMKTNKTPETKANRSKAVAKRWSENKEKMLLSAKKSGNTQKEPANKEIEKAINEILLSHITGKITLYRITQMIVVQTNLSDITVRKRFYKNIGNGNSFNQALYDLIAPHLSR
ncbi:MAG: hypothetical protein LBL52_02125 [Rickettsiales bacterium]|jgi:hypothetical protein|nr:hypothetical protein [Rickettsiales bacterium]